MMSEKQALPRAFAAEALSLDRESVGDLFDILVVDCKMKLDT